MIVKPSIAFNDFAGTAKDVTARNVKGRNILSSLAQHSKIVTPAQAVSRNRLSRISRTFRQLSDSQINRWEILAGHMKGISTLGQAAEMTAHNAFVRINSNLQMVGEPMLADAPDYICDVPEVLYDDLWISPEMIIFTGLQQPSESHVLVFKMSPALSPGVSSGWGQTVIITPGLAPDWGDADLTALYTSVMGVAPEAGKSVLGTSAKISGANLYSRLNYWIVFCGGEALSNPPALQGVEAPTEAVVTLTPTKFTFELEGEPDNAADLKLIIMASAPQSNGVTRAYGKAVQIAQPLEAVCEEYDIKEDFDNKHGASNAAAPKVFMKYFFVNTKTGEKSGEMLTLVRLDEDAPVEGE